MTVEIRKFGDPFKGADNGIDKGNIEICIKVTSQAKVSAPVAKKYGGALRNSIMWRTDKDEGGFNKDSGSAASKMLGIKPGKFKGVVGSALDYATYQEWGTRKMAPQPFLRPAIALVVKGQSVKTVLAKIQRETMKGALKKGVKRVRF